MLGNDFCGVDYTVRTKYGVFSTTLRGLMLFRKNVRRTVQIIASCEARRRALLRDVARTLCAFLLLFGIPWATFGDNAKPLTTLLLVARTELPDANFKDSVVLVMNNIGPAPVGIIINRPTRIAVSHLFPDLDRLAPLDDKVYFGGPVEIASVSFLFRADTPPEHATQILDGVYVSTNGELLRKLLARDKPMEGLRIFVGHSGWALGQLEAEIARGDWTLAPAETDAIFHGKSEHPWPEHQAPDDVHRT